MGEDIEYIKIIEELKASVDVLLKGFYDLKEEVKKLRAGKIDLSRQFSIINLPSEGVYYKDKKKSLLIRYLTAVEEHVLVDSMLMESGKGLELVLNNLIMEDINVRELLLSDFQALLIFLRSTAYGDSVDITPTCPHCGNVNKSRFKLSDLKFKTPETSPNEDGKYIVYLPELNMEFIISPVTFEKEIEKIENETESDFFEYKDEEGVLKKIKKEKSLNLVYNIDSINGITDKEKIKSVIRKQPKRYIDVIAEFIKNNEVGVDENIKLNCEFCGEDFVQNVSVGYNFLSLPPEHKQSIYEDMFLITYYGKGITREDAMKMPVVERHWHIRRIKEEIDKKNEAEKAEMNKAKGKKGKF